MEVVNDHILDASNPPVLPGHCLSHPGKGNYELVYPPGDRLYPLYMSVIRRAILSFQLSIGLWDMVPLIFTGSHLCHIHYETFVGRVALGFIL